jgi:hypothetical protein
MTSRLAARVPGTAENDIVNELSLDTAGLGETALPHH